MSQRFLFHRGTRSRTEETLFFGKRTASWRIHYNIFHSCGLNTLGSFLLLSYAEKSSWHARVAFETMFEQCEPIWLDWKLFVMPMTSFLDDEKENLPRSEWSEMRNSMPITVVLKKQQRRTALKGWMENFFADQERKRISSLETFEGSTSKHLGIHQIRITNDFLGVTVNFNNLSR